jgi:phosphatidylglycerol---prolipoprotein diacylglyceryl transferase
MIEININPVLFSIGPLEVRWYGIMIAVGVIALILWTLREIRHGAKISPDALFTAAIVGIPSGIIFSRVLHLIDNWSYYAQHTNEIIGGGGLAAYGAILGATLGIYLYAKFSHRFNFGYFADIVAPGVILAQAFGRVGCTINGCCYGSPTNLPWGIVYTQPNSFSPLGISEQPSTVYEIIWNLGVFAVLLLLRKKLKPDGSLFMVYLASYSLFRLVSDFVRDGKPFLFGLHEAQVIAIIVLLITVPVLAFRTRWAKPEVKTKAIE